MYTSARSSSDDQTVSLPQQSVSGGGVAIGKEVEVVGVSRVEAAAIKEIGREIELPPNVTNAGVQVRPTTVQIPKPVAQMGVKPAGQTVMPPAVSVSLPLSDEQIAKGMHQGITSSWRWLAEWCRRRLKQAHIVLKTFHGKIARVKS